MGASPPLVFLWHLSLHVFLWHASDLRSVIENSSTAESTAASSLLSKPFEPGFSEKRSRVSSNVPSPPYDIAKARL